MRGIFRRRYFSNNGPLVQQLDGAMAQILRVPHAVCVTNESVGLMIAAKALAQTGEAIVPALASPGLVQSLRFAGLTPVVCDVEPDSGTICARSAERAVSSETRILAAVHFLGRRCETSSLDALARRKNLEVLFDARQSLRRPEAWETPASLGSATVFSLVEPTVLDAGEGGCVATADRQVADQLRTMRNFHSNQTFTPVPLRINGKMSEAQAALALLGLDAFARNVEANRRGYEAYIAGLHGLKGVRLRALPEPSNFQVAALQVEEGAAGLTAAEMRAALMAENIPATRVFHVGRLQERTGQAGTLPMPTPVADRIFRETLQLPNPGSLSPQEIAKICRRVADILAQAKQVRKLLRSRA